MTVAKDVLADVAEAVRANGWARLPGAVDRAAIDQLRAGISALVQGVAPDGRCLYFYESLSGDRRVTRVERVWEAIPSLAGGDLGRLLEQAAEACLGGQVCLFKDKVNVRWPASAGYAPHQDTAAGWEEFAPTFVSLVLFLDGSDSESGGFEVVTGRHREGRFENARGEMSLPMFEGMSPQPVGCGAGDVLLLDGGAPHRTSPNTTQACITHLIVSFNARSAGDHRSSYYAAKVRDFASGRISPNQFVFRVFEFGPKAKPGG